MGVGHQPAEGRADPAEEDPEDIDDARHAHVPGEADRLAALAPDFGLGILRVGEEEEAERLLCRMPVGDAAAERAGIEHVAEIDGEDRQHDQPGRDVLAEQFDADHLAGAAKDRGGGKHGFEDRQAVLHRDRAEQQAERRRRHHHRQAELCAVEKVTGGGGGWNGHGGHRGFRQSGLSRSGMLPCHINSLEPDCEGR